MPALIPHVSINIIIMLNKYASESKRKDLGLPLVIFAQAFQRTSENKIIKGIFWPMPNEYRTDEIHKLFIYKLGQRPSKLVYILIVPPIKK
jgi:hypothetical protein